MIVVDASAVLDVLLRTPAAGAVEARIFTAGMALHAPHVIDLEIAQALRRCASAYPARAAGYRQALADWLSFPVTRHRHNLFLDRIWDLRHNVSAYDAAYVTLAEALGIPLVTRDAKLARSAGHSARIELVG